MSFKGLLKALNQARGSEFMWQWLATIDGGRLSACDLLAGWAAHTEPAEAVVVMQELIARDLVVNRQHPC